MGGVASLSPIEWLSNQTYGSNHPQVSIFILFYHIILLILFQLMVFSIKKLFRFCIVINEYPMNFSIGMYGGNILLSSY